jgi:hypothetical protein
MVSNSARLVWQPAVPQYSVISALVNAMYVAPICEFESEPQASPDAGGDRPLWPLLVEFGAPAAALGTIAGHAWWRARLAGRKGRHL